MVRENEALVRTAESHGDSEDVNEPLCDPFAHQKSSISGDVDSECPAPNRFLIPRERTLHAVAKSRAILRPIRRSLTTALASVSASRPHAGHECSHTYNGFSVETLHDAHSLVVPLGLAATRYYASRCPSARIARIRDGGATTASPRRPVSRHAVDEGRARRRRRRRRERHRAGRSGSTPAR